MGPRQEAGTNDGADVRGGRGGDSGRGQCDSAETFPFGGLSCQHDDSGSAILNGQEEVIGLLVEMDDDTYDGAGNPVSSVGRAIPIQTVLDDLEVEVAVSPPSISQINPNSGLGALGVGGWTQIDG